MSAPVMAPSAIASIAADIAAVQARIAAIRSPGVGPATAAGSAGSAGSATSATSAASSASAASFADALSDAQANVFADAAPRTSGSGVTGADVVADAKRYLGIPYVWGGESTSGMDCSGLVQRTFADLGIDLPRVAADQQQVGTPVASLADARPGDLLFFGHPAHHVAIYLGNNQLIEAPEPGQDVHITAVYRTPTSISRIVTPDAGGATGGRSAGQLTAAGLDPAVAAYAGQFAAAEARFGLPSGLLAAVAQQESGGDPNAVSPAGAQGLMQLMPATAAGAGVDAFDPAQAITAAARILHDDLARFGHSVPLALAAYNAGAGAVQRYGGIPPYTETQNYVRSITAMMNAGA